MMPTIRPMAQRDLPVVTALSARLGYLSTPDAIECRYPLIAQHDDCALCVAEFDGAVVGWVYVRGVLLLEDEPRAEVWGLVVDERHRRQGTGEALMRQAVAWAREAGYRALRLRSNIGRGEAHALYQRIGYRIANTSHIFWKSLGA
jgi:GNAT superfamily N-acetyltransferase